MSHSPTVSPEGLISIGKASAGDLAVSRARLWIVMTLFVLAYGVISFRVVDVAMFGKDVQKYTATPASEEYQPIAVKARADIVDRNGVLLAVNLATASLYANPKLILDPKKTAANLAKIFPDLDKADVQEKLSSDKSFVWVKRNLTPDEQYNVNALGEPGLHFKEEEKRVYPHKELLSHILGFVNVDGKGMSGIERQFETYLSGTSDMGTVNEPLQLAVDIRVQSIVRDELARAVEEFKALGAAAMVMDVHTGELVSMVSLPDFNLNNPGEATEEARFNRATYGVYEMGSTMKTYTMALGFELGDIGMNKTYDVTEPIKISRFLIRDYHPKPGLMTVPEIFMYSSNIGTAKIAMDVGPEEQRSFMERLGLLSELELEVPEKGMPLFPARWSKISSLTVSYGHGIAVSPAHIVQSIAAMINGGMMHPVTLVKKNKFDFFSSGQRVISKATSDKMRKLMRLVVKHGTGGLANVPGYLVGGKTGSADKPSKGKYNRKALISSFVSAFPMNDPQYVVLVVMDEPVGNKRTGGYTTGGMVAAPIVGEIIKKTAPLLGVMPVDEDNPKIKKEFWSEYDEKDSAANASDDH